MKSLLKLSIACAICAALAAPNASALEAVPKKLNVQGVLRNVSGEVVTGSYLIWFRIYTTETGGTVLHAENQTLYVTGGVFSAYLGPVPDTTFKNRTDAWLEIQVGSDTPLPRRQLTATGFAIQAEHAEQSDEATIALDVQCTGCVGNNDVDLLYALSDTKGGAALNVNCPTTGCVTGGTSATNSEIGGGSIYAFNMAANAVATATIQDGAVTNAKLGADAVRTGNILDGQVMTNDIANGAITSAKIFAGAITNAELGINYAGSDSKGGEANSVKCGTGTIYNAPCVDQNEVTFTFARGVSQNGAAADLSCTGCVISEEVAFNWAAGTTKGGAAGNLDCTNCVEEGEVNFPYAASNTEKGDAIGLTCTGCVGDTDLGVYYARGVDSAGNPAKGGAAADLVCNGCVNGTDVSFYYAAGDAVAGNATGLVCSSCVDTSDMRAGAITNAAVNTNAAIQGTKILAATTSVRGTVAAGTGLNVDTNGLLTVKYGTAAGTAAEGNHTHSEYYINGSGTNDLNLAHGKKFNFWDTGDNPPASGPGYYAYFIQGTAGNSNSTSVRLVLGPDATNLGKERFEIYSDGIANFSHWFDATGAAYHKGSLTLDGALSCTGCVDSQDIATGAITSDDIANGTIKNEDFQAGINIITTGYVKATGGMYAPRYYDSDDTSNTYYVDPSHADGSVLNKVNYNVITQIGRSNMAGNYVGLNGDDAYLDSINTETAGNALDINNNRCGHVTMFAGSCNTGAYNAYIYGNEYANKWIDNNSTSRWVDPSADTQLEMLHVNKNNSWLGDSSGNNYIRGKTYAFGTRWEDENGTYFLDPSITTKFNDLELNWLRLYNRGGFPGSASGYAQILNNGGHIYVSPDNASGYFILNGNGDDALYFNVNGGVNTNRASITTNHYWLRINAAAGDPKLYLNENVGGQVWTNGTFYATNLVDRNSTSYSCVVDPSGTSLFQSMYSVSGKIDNFATANLYANQMGLAGGDSQFSPGCTSGACSHIGGSNSGFKSMWSIVYNGYSNRDLKRDIHYLSERELQTTVADALFNLKPATYFYKQEKNIGDPDASRFDIRTAPHYGLMLDEMPDFMVSSGGGWSLNDSIGFLLVGAKYLEDQNREKDEKIRDLEDRVAVMEQALVDAGLIK